MADNKGMSDEKKARLEAIRAAKRAQGDGDAQPAAAAAPATTIAPAILEAASPAQTPAGNATAPAAARSAAGASMSDDKKARLEAIRAANAAKQGTGGAAAAPAAGGAAAAAAPAAATPAARPTAAPAAAAPAAPRPAAARPTPKTAPIEDDRVPMGTIIRRAIIGAVFGAILCLMLATMTGNFIVAGIWGVLLGALGGVLVLNWPPERTTGE